MSDMQEGWWGWCTEATTEHRVRWGWEDSRGPTQGTILRAAMEDSEKASQPACYAHLWSAWQVEAQVGFKVQRGAPGPPAGLGC